MTGTFTDYDARALPAAVVAYLDARDANRHADAAALFASDATVTDDGTTFDGLAAITAWIENSSTEFDYTTTRLGYTTDGASTTVLTRIDGNFPGGTVHLLHRFETDGGTIRRLLIEPAA